MKELITAAVLSAVLIAGTAHYNPAKAEGPSMSTAYVSLNKGVTLEDCLKKSAYQFKEAGLVNSVSVQDNSIYAQQGDYTAHIRCLLPKDNSAGVAYFVVAGPDVKVASKVIDFLTDKF